MLIEARGIGLIQRYRHYCQRISKGNYRFFSLSSDSSVMLELNSRSSIDNTISDSAMVIPKTISGV
jgi:hypothetical protein